MFLHLGLLKLFRLCPSLRIALVSLLLFLLFFDLGRHVLRHSRRLPCLIFVVLLLSESRPVFLPRWRLGLATKPVSSFTLFPQNPALVHPLPVCPFTQRVHEDQRRGATGLVLHAGQIARIMDASAVKVAMDHLHDWVAHLDFPKS
jgi:hypothetical protein